MKRTTIIGITFVLWIVGLTAMFIGVEKFIEKKDDRLSRDIRVKLNNAFTKHQYIDISYSGYRVGYEYIAIPEKPFSLFEMDSRRIDEWNDDYGDLYRMSKIKYKNDEDGWNFVILEKDMYGVYQSWLFPYAVGYKKQTDSWMYNYEPSVKEAVNEAFEFWTTSPKSQFIDTFEKGCLNKMWSKIYDCINEYYLIIKDDTPRLTSIGTPIFEDYSKSKSSLKAGYMHNGYYKVFLGKTQPETWSITRMDWKVESDKNRLWRNWGIGLTLLLLLIVIPLWIVENKRNKIKEETLYDRLLRLCNPSNFVKNYDKDKVDRANNIYKRLLSVSSDDKEALEEIGKQAVEDLGITLIDSEKLNELKNKVNPKNFMNPYNADKVSLANDLFAQLNEEGLTFTEFVKIEELSKQL